MSKKKKQLSMSKRILYFVIGIGIASSLMVFSFQWNLLPLTLTAAGIDVTPYALSAIIVLASVFAGSLIKSAVLGQAEMD